MLLFIFYILIIFAAFKEYTNMIAEATGIDLSTIVTAVVGFCTTTASAIVSWLLAKRKYNAEVDSNVIKNMQDSLEFYAKLSDDNKHRLDETRQRNEMLEKEIAELRRQLFELMSSICYDMSCELRVRQQKKSYKRKKDDEDNPQSH